MAQGTPVQAVKEHKKILDEIDDTYMDTVCSAAALRTYLARRGGGNKREIFLSFYNSFYELFTHTRFMEGMDAKMQNDPPDYSLVKEIEGWFADAETKKFRNAPVPFIRDGIDLFAAYQQRLITKAVITVKR